MMARRITDTVNIYALGQVVHSYTQEKRENFSWVKIQQHLSKVETFISEYTAHYQLKLLQEYSVGEFELEKPEEDLGKLKQHILSSLLQNMEFFLTNIPLDNINALSELLRENVKDYFDYKLATYLLHNFDYGISTNLQKKYVNYDSKIQDMINQIMNKPLHSYNFTFNMLIELCVNIVEDISSSYHLEDPEDIIQFLFKRNIITMLPILNKLQTLFYIFKFYKFLGLFTINRGNEREAAIYAFIKKNFHNNCIEENDETRNHFLNNFKAIKRLLPKEKIMEITLLFKFIVYLKTYHTALRKGFLFNRQGYVTNEVSNLNLDILFKREAKKYTPVFSNDNHNYDKQ